MVVRVHFCTTVELKDSLWKHHKLGIACTFVTILFGIRILIIFFALDLTKAGVNFFLLDLSKLLAVRLSVGVLQK